MLRHLCSRQNSWVDLEFKSASESDTEICDHWHWPLRSHYYYLVCFWVSTGFSFLEFLYSHQPKELLDFRRCFCLWTSSCYSGKNKASKLKMPINMSYLFQNASACRMSLYKKTWNRVKNAEAKLVKEFGWRSSLMNQGKGSCFPSLMKPKLFGWIADHMR